MWKNRTVNKFAIYANNEMQKRNWNQAELVRRSGLTRQTVSRFFSEKSKEPDRETLEGVAKGLGIPLDMFYRESGVLPPEEGYEPVVEETAHIMKNLPKEEQVIIRDFAKHREQV